MMRIYLLTILAIVFLVGCSQPEKIQPTQQEALHTNETKTLGRIQAEEIWFMVSDQKFPQTAQFLKKGFKETQKELCTLDRSKKEREELEASIQQPEKKEGYVRVQWPLTFCKESEGKVHVGYLPEAEYKQVGDWLQKELANYPDGEKLLFQIGEKQEIQELFVDTVPGKRQ